MAEAIERRMVQRGLAPGTFASLASLTPQGLADVRAGKRKRYLAGTRMGVARALQWPVDWYDRLLAGEDPGTFPDTIHPDRPGTDAERLTAVEDGLRDLSATVAQLLDELRQRGR